MIAWGVSAIEKMTRAISLGGMFVRISHNARSSLRTNGMPTGQPICTSPITLHLSQNPNGIPSHSPGLRVTRYPGKESHRMINPNGVVSSCFKS